MTERLCRVCGRPVKGADYLASGLCEDHWVERHARSWGDRPAGTPRPHEPKHAGGKGWRKPAKDAA